MAPFECRYRRHDSAAELTRFDGPSQAAETESERPIHLVVESMVEHGQSVPEEPRHEVEVTIEPRVAITV
jgi:hypothetical protein